MTMIQKEKNLSSLVYVADLVKNLARLKFSSSPCYKHVSKEVGLYAYFTRKK